MLQRIPGKEIRGYWIKSMEKEGCPASLHSFVDHITFLSAHQMHCINHHECKENTDTADNVVGQEKH